MKKIYLTLLISLLATAIQAQDHNFEWAKSMGGLDQDHGNSITTDASGNVYVTGEYYGTVDFDPDSGTFNLTSNGFKDVFIQKLSADGNLIWAKSIGGIFNDVGNSIITDVMGNMYVSGSYTDTVDFDPGVSSFNLISNGSIDAFILKLDSGGNFIWAKSMGGISTDNGYSITSDGNLYLTGSFKDTVDFDPGVGIFNLISNGNNDVFIQKLDANGNFIWAKSFGAASGEAGFSIALDDSANVYVTGVFQSIVDFDPGVGIFNLTSNGSTDIFIQKLDSSGTFVWARSMGGGLGDAGYSITSDGNVYVIGYFQGTVDFDPGVGIFNLTSNGSTDIFIQKLNAAGNLILG